MRPFNHCLHPILVGDAPGTPPVAFLEELVTVIAALPEEIFAPNDEPGDVMNIIEPVLGPWTSAIHRRAALCEVLRVTAGFESGWRWNEGADATAGRETPAETETGAWQVSANSTALDKRPVDQLDECLIKYLSDRWTIQDFITEMKANHALAVEYAARLFRKDTRWSGPTNRGWTKEAVYVPAVTEFEQLLSQPCTPQT